MKKQSEEKLSALKVEMLIFIQPSTAQNNRRTKAAIPNRTAKRTICDPAYLLH